jgi:hypothetical protein
MGGENAVATTLHDVRFSAGILAATVTGYLAPVN